MSSSTEELKNTVIEKLRNDPLSITTDDARRLSEQVEATDRRSATIVSAVESLAALSHEIKQGPPPMFHDPRHAQAALVNDLNAAVEKNPSHVTSELLKATQAIVSKMQRAIGQTNAPHPELEAELQAEIAKIEPKIEQGTVTKAEADHLHSLEARAHGHTEKGGVTAIAQSVAAKRERALSLEVEKIEPKIEQGTVTKEEANHLQSLEARIHGHTEKGDPAANAQSVAAKRERQRSETLSDNTNESGQAYRDSSGITKSTPATAISSSEVTVDKLTALNIKENHQNDYNRDDVHGHSRKGSESTAVEAH